MSQQLLVKRVLEFLANYGEKGLLVLKAAVESALRDDKEGKIRLGDFSFREIVEWLKKHGIRYNPSMILRSLERDYGIIETSYHSSGQHWWNFIDLAAVIDALDRYENGASVEDDDILEDVDPRIEVLRAQFAALGLDKVLARLRSLVSKPSLTYQDRLFFSRFAFDILEHAASLYEKMLEFEEEFSEELKILREVIILASKLSRRIIMIQKSKLGLRAREEDRVETLEEDETVIAGRETRKRVLGD
ncbi:MAG: hypothetical protein ABWW69_00345 [Pyrodictiaceae archaeon]